MIINTSCFHRTESCSKHANSCCLPNRIEASASANGAINHPKQPPVAHFQAYSNCPVLQHQEWMKEQRAEGIDWWDTWMKLSNWVTYGSKTKSEPIVSLHSIMDDSRTTQKKGPSSDAQCTLVSVQQTFNGKSPFVQISRDSTYIYSRSHMRSPLKSSRPSPPESPCISRLFWVYSNLDLQVKVAVKVISAECWVLLRVQDFNTTLLSSSPFRAPPRKLKNSLNSVKSGDLVENARSYFADNFVVANSSSLSQVWAHGPNAFRISTFDVWMSSRRNLKGESRVSILEE